MVKALYYNDKLEDYYFAWILSEIYKEKIYFPYLSGKTDLTIVDIGANVGLTTNYFADYAKKVISVEPTQENFDLLTKLIKHNDLKNVTPLKLAISYENKMVTIHHNTNKTMHSISESIEDKTQEPERVQAITVKRLLEENKLDHVDLLKLDPEGEESLILCSKSFAEIAGKIDVIIWEWHQWSNRNPAQTNAVLRDLGFRTRQLPTEATVFVAERVK